ADRAGADFEQHLARLFGSRVWQLLESQRRARSVENHRAHGWATLLRRSPAEDDLRGPARRERDEIEPRQLRSRRRILDEHAAPGDPPRLAERVGVEGRVLAVAAEEI